MFDELPGDRLLWPGEHVEHRAFFDDAAVFHHRYAVADFAHHVHLVGDQHDGQFQLAVDVQQQVENGVGGLRIERRGGLVAQQHARVIGQRAGDADALFLAAAELRRVGVFAPRRPTSAISSATRGAICALGTPAICMEKRCFG